MLGLYCRSIELALKAFLLAKGLTKKELKSRKLGHDLVALSGKAKKMGLDDYLVVNREWEINLSNANDYYYKKDFEYFNVAFQYYGLPSLDELNEYSKGLLKSIRQVCIDAASLQSGS